MVVAVVVLVMLVRFGISRVGRAPGVQLLSWYRISPLVLARLTVAILLKLTLHF